MEVEKKSLNCFLVRSVELLCIFLSVFVFMVAVLLSPHPQAGMGNWSVRDMMDMCTLCPPRRAQAAHMSGTGSEKQIETLSAFLTKISTLQTQILEQFHLVAAKITFWMP